MTEMQKSGELKVPNSVVVFRKRFSALICIVVFVGGCQGALFSYRGGTVKQADRLPILAGGEHVASWKAYDLTVNYQYVRNQDELKISGVVEFTDQLKNNFLLIKYFHLDGIFLDSQGKVLAEKGLVSDSRFNSTNSLSFSSALKLPKDAVSMAFSYTGDALTGSDDGGNFNFFWAYPFSSM